MSIVSTATKKRMYDLAEEILSEERQNREAEAKGYTRNSDSLCRLYDDADHEFRASRIKSLLDEVANLRKITDKLQAWVEQKPFMYGIVNPDGDAYIDEFCVANDPGVLEDEVNALNENLEDGVPPFQIVTLYRHSVADKPAPVDGIDFTVANGQVFISNCFILDDNPVFSGVDWAKGCTPAGKAQVMPDFEGVSAMTQRECYRAGLEAGKARRMPDGWKQWIDDVVEYLKDGLETDGELEAEGSIEAKRLLAAAPQQEER